jgi:hypothetical protein
MNRADMEALYEVVEGRRHTSVPWNSRPVVMNDPYVGVYTREGHAPENILVIQLNICL